MPQRKTTVRAVVFAIAALTASAALLGGSARGSAETTSITVLPSRINYGKPSPTATTITGRLSSGQRGVRVVLEGSAWPFSSGFEQLASTRTGVGGEFAFTQRPSLATRYRVRAPGALSPVRNVYVQAGNARLRCTISGHHVTVRCGDNLGLGPGRYTLRFSFDYLFPASAFGTESAKAVYFYYGQRSGSLQLPSALTLQGTTTQRARAGHTTHVAITQAITVPRDKAWSFYINACIQTTEPTDGLGLSGTPGSHHCGDRTISLQDAKHGTG